MLALVGFYFLPLAPPRLMPGFVDTVVAHHTWGSLASANVASLANQYAAMPSMHIGWSLWSGIAVLLYAQRRWARVLGLLYPLATLVAVVSTGNHYLLDAAGGALTLACGYALQHFLTARMRVRHPARRPIMAFELGTDGPRAVGHSRRAGGRRKGPRRMPPRGHRVHHPARGRNGCHSPARRGARRRRA
jgi:hypothetical protein